MNTYKALIAYDGTDYCGWQHQPRRVSVAQQLEDSFFKTFGKKIKVTGVSRTDAGVHADGQVVHFKTDVQCEAQKLCFAWNNCLPETIHIHAIEQMPKDFNPFLNVKQKIYSYTFFTQRPLPQFTRFGWFVRKKVDMQKLQSYLDIFIGTHDFKSFRSSDDKRINTIRTIDVISIEQVPEQHAYKVLIKGKSFMQHMIRRIVGACIQAASCDTISIELLHKTLVACNPNHPFVNAPAKGLLLQKIIYKDTK